MHDPANMPADVIRHDLLMKPGETINSSRGFEVMGWMALTRVDSGPVPHH